MAKKDFPGQYTVETVQRFITIRNEAGYGKRGQTDPFVNLLLDRFTQPETITPVEQTTPPETTSGHTVEEFVALIGLYPHEQAAVTAMLAQTGMELAGLMRSLLVQELTRHARGQQRLQGIDWTDPDARSRRKGTGYVYLRDILDQWIAENERASDPNDRRYITAKGLEKRSQSSPVLIRKFLKDYRERIDAHHVAMGWESEEEGKSHNHKAGNLQRDIAREQRKAVREDALVLQDVYEGALE